MYAESDLLALSGLQHLAYCERQWALIHIEQFWAENRLTTQGRLLHERADKPGGKSRGDLRIVRGLPIHSLRLGLAGRADVVELHRIDRADSDETATTTERPPVGIRLHQVDGLWRPFPVEYKRGKPKAGNCDRVQLCAQALCLEEMLDVSIAAGALFYGRTRRREEVAFDPTLRDETETLAARMHEMFRAGNTPRVRYTRKRCDRCSLYSRCLPKTTGQSRSVGTYLTSVVSSLDVDS